MLYVTPQGIKIAYYTDGQGEPLVLVRGYATAASMWYAQVPELRRWFRVITFDNRDTGNSDRVEAPYSISEMADDTIGLIEHLNLGPVHLLGVSMGGMIAQQTAIRRPDLVKTLILACTTCNSGQGMATDPEVLKLFATLPELSEEENVRRSLPVFFSARSLGQKELIDRYVRESLAQRPPLTTFARHTRAIQGFDLCQELHRIAAPTLIQHGRGDRLLPWANAERLKALMPQARLIGYEGLGHLFFMENPPAVNGDIREFISAVKPIIKPTKGRSS